MKRRRRAEEIKQQNWKINVANVSKRFLPRTTFMSVRMDISIRNERAFRTIRYHRPEIYHFIMSMKYQ